jgi:cyanophycinase
MSPKSNGKLIIIGGHEDKKCDQNILKQVVEDSKKYGGSIAVVTVASQEPKKMAEEYIKAFHDLGVSKVEIINIRERGEAEKESNVEKINKAGAIFFTGGDQMRITSQIGDSLVFQTMQKCLKNGKTIAGTSAGAAAMPETMIVSGDGDVSNSMSSMSMAPGLAFAKGLVIDSHFSERGRINRLLTAVVQNPKNLGLGIDENTAVVMEGEERFRVLGSGAVYVVDGKDITDSSLSEESTKEEVISMFNVIVHVLADGYEFDLAKRCPIKPS